MHEDNIKHLNKQNGRAVFATILRIVMTTIFYYGRDDNIFKIIFIIMFISTIISAYRTIEIFLRGTRTVATVMDLKTITRRHKASEHKYYNLSLSYEEENLEETTTWLKEDISYGNNIMIGDKYNIIYLKKRKNNCIILLDLVNNEISNFIVLIFSILLILLNYII